MSSFESRARQGGKRNWRNQALTRFGFRFDSAAPVKRTSVERQVNRQIFFMFIALIVLSLASTVGSSIRSVSTSRPPSPFLLFSNSELTSPRPQWVFSSKQWYLAGDISSNKGSFKLDLASVSRLFLTRRSFPVFLRSNSQAVHRGFVYLSPFNLPVVSCSFSSWLADILTFIILYNNLIPISFVLRSLLLSFLSFPF